MQFNLFNWLFQDPISAASGSNYPDGVEPFHFYLPWLIFCGAGLLLCFYYWVEGRKRFVKNKPLVKYMMDRYLGWFAVICFVGFPIAGARWALTGFFFAWRAWRYLWLLSLVVWAVLWLVYLFRKYPAERANYIAYQNRQQYIRQGKRKGRAKAAAR